MFTRTPYQPMKKPVLLFALLIFLTSAACAIPVQTRWSVEPTPTLASKLQLPDGTQPISNPPDQTQAALDGEIVNPGEIPAPAIPVSSSQRTMPEGVVNIMLLGSDFRVGAGHRTDVILLVSVNPVKQTVSVISFPRDLYVPIPGWTTQRINTAEPHGGFDTLADTMEANFSVRPSYYVLTDFEGFKSIINRLGGVDVYAGATLVDRCDLPIAENGKCTITPGLHSMDGDTALWYIRSRYSSSDLDRLRRAQEVLAGIFVRIMSGGAIQDLPGLYASYQGSVKTNLTAQAMLPLLPTATKVFSDRQLIKRYALTVNEAKPFVTESGAQVLLPDYERIDQILDDAIFNP